MYYSSFQYTCYQLFHLLKLSSDKLKNWQPTFSRIWIRRRTSIISLHGKKFHPKEEGGIGLRSTEDVCKSMEYKKWWWFRIQQALWSDFLHAKYCKRSYPIFKKIGFRPIPNLEKNDAQQEMCRNIYPMETSLRQLKLLVGQLVRYWALGQLQELQWRVMQCRVSEFWING